MTLSDQFIRDACRRGEERRKQEAAEKAASAARYRRSPLASSAPLAEVLSPSQVNTYTDCQARWWFQYGLNLPSITTGKQAMGSAVHEAITYNFMQKIESGRDLTIPEVLENYAIAWEAAAIETSFRDDENPDEIKATGSGLVKVYMAEAAPKIRPAAVEQPLPETSAIAGVKIQGRPDIRDVDGMLIDVKTSSKSPVGVMPSHMFQLATYTELAPRASGKVRVDTLVATKTPKLVQMTRSVESTDVRNVRAVYPLVQEAMRSGYYVPNRNSMFCSRRNCSYWRSCQAEFGGTVEES